MDARTDLHALGVLLYEMSIGQRPFPEAQGPRLIDAILNTAPVPPSRFQPRLSTELERIILKCLEKDPENRYQYAEEVGVDLRRLRTSASVSAVREPIPSQFPWRRAVVASLVVVVLLAVLFALNVGGWRERLLAPAAMAPIKSLAVLPLDNISGDPEQEYFPDGMTDALIAELGQIGALRVISRQSVMRYKGSDKPLPEIARELNVDAVVEGSVLRSGERVRVTAQLIGATPERHLWAETFDRDLGDVLALHSEVAQAIARKIEIAVTPQEQTRLASARPVNPEAHEAYLKGRYFLRRGDWQRAIEFAQQAIEIDPGYAPGYELLAFSYYESGWAGVNPWREATRKARAAARKALEIDDTLAQAHSMLAVAQYIHDWDWAGAEREFKRAIELNPNLAEAHGRYALYLMTVGRPDEAFRMANRALELDPMSPIMNQWLTILYRNARQYDQAIENGRKVIEILPNSPDMYLELSRNYEAKGMYDEAIAARQKSMTLQGESPEDVAALGHAYEVGGIRGAWRWQLERLKERSTREDIFPVAFARAYALLGENDQAFEWLEKGYEQHYPLMAYVKGDPGFDNLRSDPRYQDLLRRMNFPE